MHAITKTGLILTLLVFSSRSILGIKTFYVEDAYFDKLNPEYIDVDNTNLEPVWFNDTESGVAINITVIKDLPGDAWGHLNVFQKVNGEYKTPSGISINEPWCRLRQEPSVMKPLLEAMNCFACPIKAGRYSIDEWHPKDLSQTPFLPYTYYRLAVLMKKKKNIFFQANVMLAVF